MTNDSDSLEFELVERSDLGPDGSEAILRVNNAVKPSSTSPASASVTSENSGETLKAGPGH